MLVRSAVVGRCGDGADTERETFKAVMGALGEGYVEHGSVDGADLTGKSPYRLAVRETDPRGFRAWRDALAEHDPIGAAHTIVGVQSRRPTLLQLAERMNTLEVPTLFVAGDEDDPCLEANLVAKRASLLAGLATLPRTSHTVNPETPDRKRGAWGKSVTVRGE